MMTTKMQFYNSPEVSWNQWFYDACYENSTLTAIGRFLQQLLQQGTFIDIPAGVNKQPAIDAIAKQLGALHYIAVDTDKDNISILQKNNTDSRNQYIISDAVDFLHTYTPTPTVHCFYISGLQPEEVFMQSEVNQVQIAVPYIKRLLCELARLTKAKDVVIINDIVTLTMGFSAMNTINIDPDIVLLQSGFAKQYTCKWGKVSVYQKV